MRYIQQIAILLLVSTFAFVTSCSTSTSTEEDAHTYVVGQLDSLGINFDSVAQLFEAYLLDRNIISSASIKGYHALVEKLSNDFVWPSFKEDDPAYIEIYTYYLKHLRDYYNLHLDSTEMLASSFYQAFEQIADELSVQGDINANVVFQGIESNGAKVWPDAMYKAVICGTALGFADVHSGLAEHLPDKNDVSTSRSQKKSNNVLTILVTSSDSLFVNKEFIKLPDLREIVKVFIDNNGKNPMFSDSPADAIVSLQNQRGTSYETYVAVYNELQRAYNELRNAYSNNQFGLDFANLTNEAPIKAVKKKYPINLAEAEPID